MSSTSPKATSAPSTAFFCPVPRLVDAAYLTEIRRQFTAKPFLKPLIGAIKETPAIWDLLARDKRAQHVASGARGDKFAKGLTKWMTEGETGLIASQPSTVVSFPLLFLTGLSQWCSYLDLSGQTHSEAIKGLAAGGIQGYCGGMLSTVAVASASNEEELGRNAENMYRVAFLLGVFMSEGEDGPPEHAPDMMIVRLKYPGQDLALLEQFPGVGHHPQLHHVSELLLTLPHKKKGLRFRHDKSSDHLLCWEKVRAHASERVRHFQANVFNANLPYWHRARSKKTNAT